MEVEKVRNLGDAELQQQLRQSAEQIFRIRFQAKLGQNEGVNKLRELKKDVARIKTIARERALGLRAAAPATSATLVQPARKAKKDGRG